MVESTSPASAANLQGRRVLLGVTGGIAAYKAVALLRQLQQLGAEVRVVMTAAAQDFVAPLTFQALSGLPVHTELLDPHTEAAMGHIELARWADAILVAPASANFLARLAHGFADDLLTTLCLASEASLFVAPAMNRVMWAHAATQANVAQLRARGVVVLGPDSGDQACGETGAGRMREPLELANELAAQLQTTGLLQGEHVLITAGPTREAIDPVRFLSNRSSGRMGFAVAAAAAKAGAQVTLIAGPVTLPTPPGVARIDVESARDMQAAVFAHLTGITVFIAVAAVADYGMASPNVTKLKKSAATLQLELVRNPDILAEVAALERPPFTLGFAAETEQVAEYARAKLRDKGVDMICANQVGPGRGFDSPDNHLHVFWHDGEQVLGHGAKTHLAECLVTLLAERLRSQRSL